MANKPESDRWVAACFISVLIFLPIAAINSKNPSPSHGQAQAPSEQSGASSNTEAQISNPVSAAPISNGHEAEPNRQQDATDNDSFYNRCIVGLTCALVVIGAIQARIYYVQSRLMRAALDHSRESSKEAIDHARESSKEAIDHARTSSRESLEHAREISERELRAYLGTVLPKYESAIKESETDDLPQLYSIFIKNGGHTPAYNVITVFEWAVFEGADAEWPEKKSFDISLENLKINESSINVGAGQIIKTSARLESTSGLTFQQAFERLIKKEVTIFIYGTITYDDIYRKQRHTTKFCRVMRQKDEKGGTVNAYHLHNDAD